VRVTGLRAPHGPAARSRRDDATSRKARHRLRNVTWLEAPPAAAGKTPRVVETRLSARTQGERLRNSSCSRAMYRVSPQVGRVVHGILRSAVRRRAKHGHADAAGTPREAEAVEEGPSSRTGPHRAGRGLPGGRGSGRPCAVRSACPACTIRTFCGPGATGWRTAGHRASGHAGTRHGRSSTGTRRGSTAGGGCAGAAVRAFSRSPRRGAGVGRAAGPGRRPQR
jgi:hypothetical protein